MQPNIIINEGLGIHPTKTWCARFLFDPGNYIHPMIAYHPFFSAPTCEADYNLTSKYIYKYAILTCALINYYFIFIVKYLNIWKQLNECYVELREKNIINASVNFLSDATLADIDKQIGDVNSYAETNKIIDLENQDQEATEFTSEEVVEFVNL